MCTKSVATFYGWDRSVYDRMNQLALRGSSATERWRTYVCSGEHQAIGDHGWTRHFERMDLESNTLDIVLRRNNGFTGMRDWTPVSNRIRDRYNTDYTDTQTRTNAASYTYFGRYYDSSKWNDELTTAAEAQDDADAELVVSSMPRKTIHMHFAGCFGFLAGKTVEVWDVGG